MLGEARCSKLASVVYVGYFLWRNVRGNASNTLRPLSQRMRAPVCVKASRKKFGNAIAASCILPL
jgi:hypothetical protein